MNRCLDRIKTNILIINQNRCSISSSSDSKNENVLYKIHNQYTAEIIFNSPKSLNSLNMNMIKSLLSTCGNWINPVDKQLVSNITLDKRFYDQTPKVIIMTGMGNKAFCAGGDVVSIYHEKKAGKNYKEIVEFFRLEFLADLVISKLIPIQISIWDGFVMGGGVGISINAPIRIATENTLWAMPETKIGLIPDVGATYFLPRIFNNNTKIGLYVGLVGERIKGKDVVKCGLATHFIHSSKLDNLKQKIMELTNEKTDLKQINEICTSFSEFIYKEDQFSFPKSEIINNVFFHDNLKDIFNKLKELCEVSKNDEIRNWAKTVLEKLKSYSPISLHLHFEQFNLGMKMTSLKEAYDLELKLIYKIIEGDELTEGVRAFLIEKDNKPKWIYKTIDEIDEKKLIKQYFS